MKYIIPLLFLTGCSWNNCDKIIDTTIVPKPIPKTMAIYLDEKTFKADDNGAEFLKQYVLSKKSLEAIDEECKK